MDEFWLFCNGEELQQQVEMIEKQTIEAKKVDLTRNSKKVIPIDLEGIEEKPIESDDEAQEELDHLNLGVIEQRQESDKIFPVESTLASLLQSQPKKSSKITLEPIKIGPSSSSILNLDATPVVNKTNVLGGGKED